MASPHMCWVSRGGGCIHADVGCRLMCRRPGPPPWLPAFRRPAAAELISTTDPSTVTEHGQFCREAAACQVYAKGRVALTGDAAHLATPFLVGCRDGWPAMAAAGGCGCVL